MLLIQANHLSVISGLAILVKSEEIVDLPKSSKLSSASETHRILSAILWPYVRPVVENGECN